MPPAGRRGRSCRSAPTEPLKLDRPWTVPADAAAGQSGPGAGTDGRLAALVKPLGIGIAVLAVALCALTLAREWNEISDPSARPSRAGCCSGCWRRRRDDRPGAALVALPGGCSAPRPGAREAVAWYFGGELGKYVPGGVWPVLGRGELADRAGISRATGYVTTLICYAAMCVAAAVVCGVLAPFVATRRRTGWAGAG